MTTLSDGTGLAVFQPVYANVSGSTAAPVVNTSFMPWSYVASSSSIYPYNAVPATGSWIGGPLSTQTGNMATYALDGFIIDYIHT
jgi:hypothetical protein